MIQSVECVGALHAISPFAYVLQGAVRPIHRLTSGLLMIDHNNGCKFHHASSSLSSLPAPSPTDLPIRNQLTVIPVALLLNARRRRMHDDLVGRRGGGRLTAIDVFQHFHVSFGALRRRHGCYLALGRISCWNGRWLVGWWVDNVALHCFRQGIDLIGIEINQQVGVRGRVVGRLLLTLRIWVAKNLVPVGHEADAVVVVLPP
jgi:hypothetical protein